MRGFLIRPSWSSFLDKDGRRTKASTKLDESSPLSQLKTARVSHIRASGRNFNTNPKIFPAIESCGLTRQKLESSFGKYELSPPEVNHTISGSPFCKHSHEVCSSPSIEKPTSVDSGDHKSKRAVVQAVFQPAIGGDLM
jgi:hypothetical protein